MRSIPWAAGFDNSIAFLSEGYLFIGNRCRRLNSDIFQTRLMLSSVICMQGAEAAEVFFAPGRLTRVGALPSTVLMSLQDAGSVATLDGEAHRRQADVHVADDAGQLGPDGRGLRSAMARSASTLGGSQ